MIEQDHLEPRPWWWSRQWWVVAGSLVGFGVTGFAYLGWAAEHQRPSDQVPVFAQFLVPFAVLAPEPTGWLVFLLVALLNVAMWAAIVYILLSAIATFRRWA